MTVPTSLLVELAVLALFRASVSAMVAISCFGFIFSKPYTEHARPETCH